MSFVVAPPPVPSVAVAGGGTFPVRRIFCVGQNYSDHVREMGGEPERAAPVFFTKPADAATSGEIVPYPPGTENLHYEGELVLALKSGGDFGTPAVAEAAIYGYAAGCDLTRRDLQAAAKKAGGPWDAAKAFDMSAPIGAILPAEQAGGLADASLTTRVNGERRQHAPLAAMIWPAPAILMALSRLFDLNAGDLVFTGTPAGVGPLVSGDAVSVEIGPLPALSFTIGPAR